MIKRGYSGDCEGGEGSAKGLGQPAYCAWPKDLLFVGVAVGGSLLGSAASGNATRATLAIRRVDGKVDVFLGVGADQEGRNVHQLLANADVTLTNEDASVMDRLGQVELEDLGLKASLHEDLRGELQDVIKRVLFVSEDTVSLQAADERGSLEKALGVLGIQSQQSSGSLQQIHGQNRDC